MVAIRFAFVKIPVSNFLWSANLAHPLGAALELEISRNRLVVIGRALYIVQARERCKSLNCKCSPVRLVYLLRLCKTGSVPLLKPVDRVAGVLHMPLRYRRRTMWARRGFEFEKQTKIVLSDKCWQGEWFVGRERFDAAADTVRRPKDAV